MSSGNPGEQRLRSYKELRIWQRGIDLSLAAYRASRDFPREELYGLTSQIRGASVSIPSNIAEGYGRSTRREYRHFLTIARGSNHELQTQLLIAEKLGFGSDEELDGCIAISEELGRMLTALLLRLTTEPR